MGWVKKIPLARPNPTMHTLCTYCHEYILGARYNFGRGKKRNGHWFPLPSIHERIFFSEAPAPVSSRMEEEIHIPRVKLGSQGLEVSFFLSHFLLSLLSISFTSHHICVLHLFRFLGLSFLITTGVQFFVFVFIKVWFFRFYWVTRNLTRKLHNDNSKIN